MADRGDAVVVSGQAAAGNGVHFIA